MTSKLLVRLAELVPGAATARLILTPHHLEPTDPVLVPRSLHYEITGEAVIEVQPTSAGNGVHVELQWGDGAADWWVRFPDTDDTITLATVLDEYLVDPDGLVPASKAPPTVLALIAALQQAVDAGVSPEQVAAAVANYFEEHPLEGATTEYVDQAIEAIQLTPGPPGEKGDPGRNVELQRSATHVQWRLVGDTTWNDLIALADITGPAGSAGADGADGREVELRKTTTHLQWRLEDSEWADLVALSDITGPAGSNGADGADGADGRDPEFSVSETHIQWRYVGDEAWTELIALDDLTGPAGSNGANGADGADGADGREVKLRANETHIQWQYDGDDSWQNIVALSDITGPSGSNGSDGADGREVEFQANNTHIQWRYVGSGSWSNLVALSEITGPAGSDGADGADGADGREVELQKTATHVQWRLDGGDWANLIALADLKGDKGDKGEPGIVTDGFAGIVAVSESEYDPDGYEPDVIYFTFPTEP